MQQQRGGRPARPQAILTVISTERIGPHLIRVHAGGPGIADLSPNEHTDAYAKLLIADPAHGLTPPYDLEGVRANAPDQLPARRTYSIRAFDTENQRVAIDFVVHGAEGIAGPWAESAQPGDVLVASGCGGGYTPDPEADWHLLVGDLSAEPAIAQALERMPATAVGHAIIHVPTSQDEADLAKPGGITLTWVHGEPADGADPLVEAVLALDWPAGTPHVFAHGERGAIKKLRRHLTDERELPRERMSISAYWARGRIEDQFQAEKREPIGQI